MTCPSGRHFPYFTLFHVLMKFHLHFWNLVLGRSQRARGDVSDMFVQHHHLAAASGRRSSGGGILAGTDQ